MIRFVQCLGADAELLADQLQILACAYGYNSSLVAAPYRTVVETTGASVTVGIECDTDADKTAVLALRTVRDVLQLLPVKVESVVETAKGAD